MKIKLNPQFFIKKLTKIDHTLKNQNYHSNKHFAADDKKYNSKSYSNIIATTILSSHTEKDANQVKKQKVHYYADNISVMLCHCYDAYLDTGTLGVKQVPYRINNVTL